MDNLVTQKKKKIGKKKKKKERPYSWSIEKFAHDERLALFTFTVLI